MACESTARTARGQSSARPRLANLRAGRDLEIGTEEDDFAVLAVGPQHEDLGDEGPDLLRGEIDDGHHAPSHQISGRVAIGDLGARSLHPQLAEIDAELDGGLPRLREWLRLEDDPHSHVDALEVGPADRHPFDPGETTGGPDAGPAWRGWRLGSSNARSAPRCTPAPPWSSHSTGR